MDLQIYVYLQRVEDAIQFAQDRKTPLTLSKIVQTAHHSINKTGLYTLELKEWRKKATKDKTWAIFKQVFVEEYHDLVEETKVTSGDSGSHSANAIQ